ncbi:MAG: zinc ribbon domain-containing protein [Proteobacteria bacterium]|jgi:putative FmdB family regulatory protein|nr:zinc ribbon domain-containing protein [Pseudomonadota bacterium]
MPIHDFQCRGCSKRFELLVLPNEKPKCPGCGSGKLERLFSGGAAVSTSRTRARTTAVARSKAGAVKKEKDHAHAEYMRNHIKDHGG